MAAATVTGLSGPGDSHGKHKCNNQCGGCGCGCNKEETPPKKIRNGCVKRISVGQKLTSSASNGIINNQVC
jgi:hypothetical protein